MNKIKNEHATINLNISTGFGFFFANRSTTVVIVCQSRNKIIPVRKEKSRYMKIVWCL